MAQIKLSISVSLLGLLGICELINQSAAECCNTKISLYPNCKTIHGCFAYICPDGTPLSSLDNFCGIGPCNIFGCNCDGGCRRNSKGYDRAEALKQYRLKTQKPRKVIKSK